MVRQFDVAIERDEDGFLVASVPQLHGSHTQARSLDEVMARMQKAIELCLEVEGASATGLEFVGIRTRDPRESLLPDPRGWP